MCSFFPGLSVYAGETDDSRVGTFSFDRFLIDHLPGGNFYTFFIENYVPDATFLTEENNGFALIDNPRVYFEGDSYLQFNWSYDGMNINSTLNDGSPGVLLPFSSVGSWGMKGESPINGRSGMDFITGPSTGNISQLTFSPVFPNVGSYWMTFMIQPSHPLDRADRLYTERRKIDSNYFVDYRYNKKRRGSDFAVNASYFDTRRQFNDFNIFNKTYDEDGRLLLLNARYKKELKTGTIDYFGVFNYVDRSNRLAETGNLPQETMDKKRFSFFTGFDLKKEKINLRLSVLLENEKLNPFEKNFSKDLMDNDGDFLYPYGRGGETKLGNFTGAAANLFMEIPGFLGLLNGKIHMDPYFDARCSLLRGDEEPHDFNAILFNNKPYEVVKWNGTGGETYQNMDLNARIGIRVFSDMGSSIRLLGNLFAVYNRLDFKDSMNDLAFLTPGFDVGIMVKSKRTRILFSYGQLPYDTRESLNFFLERRRPSGTIYNWEDRNGDLKYQPGEEAAVFGYTGGQYRYVSEDIESPMKERFLIQFTTPVSKNFVLNIKGIYKKIRDPFRVKFNSEGEYGFYEKHNGYNIYFFDQPADAYYLSNGGYEKDPFYAQLLIDLQGRRADKWFFSFSFMAHIGMGVTAFGNGPGSNDIGILDENQANPNSWINGYGRLDGDRGFVAKSYFGFYIAKNLFMGMSLKYRDGNPFAFFNTLYLHGQRVIYYQTIKAENEKGVKGGPREDYVGDLSMNLNYRFFLFNNEASLNLAIFNILDIGTELSEYVFSGGTRDAMEMQIPRSIRLTLQYRF